MRESNPAPWALRSLGAIRAVVAPDGSFEPSLWDLFEVAPPHLARAGDEEHLGEVVEDLDHRSLRHLAGWIEENQDGAIERYGLAEWLDVSTLVHLAAFFGRSGLQTEDITETREGTKFFLRARRMFRARGPGAPASQRDVARRLGVAESWLRRMRDRAARSGHPLDGPPRPVPLNVIYEVLGKGKRGPKP